MATNTVQYPDGRQEIINLPKAFSVGDVVAVTHRRDGGVVVQRVSPAEILSGSIQLESGGISGAFTTVRVKLDITVISKKSYSSITLMCYGSGPPPYAAQITREGSAIVTETLETADATKWGDTGDVYLILSVNAGTHIIIDNAMYSFDSGATWNYTADGNCSSGSFVSDHDTGWVKTEDGVTATFASGGIEIV